MHGRTSTGCKCRHHRNEAAGHVESLAGDREPHLGHLPRGAQPRLSDRSCGELVRLTVGQFQETRLEVSAGKTGKSRFVSLTTQGVAVFKKLVKGRSPDAPMLPNAEMNSWSRMQIARAMRAAVAAAQLETSAQFYDLRRSYGSLLANAQANDATIAHALGHADTRMTRRHYAHLLDSVVAAELQAKLPTFKARRSRKNTAQLQ
jgi:integrase